jgi:surface polysaccharide O-acyltransferase-like enzyme
MKLICAYLVCLIHIEPFNITVLPANQVELMNMIVQQYLCRIAVPFCFITSGFLFFRKTEAGNISNGRIKNYCFRNLRLLGLWIMLLFVGDHDHLWYLSAVVFATLVLSFLINKGVSIWKITLFALFTYFIGMLFGGSYSVVAEYLKSFRLFSLMADGFGLLFSSARNGLFFGMIYVLIGAIFATKRIVINIKTAIIGFVISMILLFFELYYLHSAFNLKSGEMYIFLLPASFFLFYIVSHIRLNDKPIYSKIKALGILVFFMHKFVGHFAEIVFAGFNRIFSWNVYAFYSIAIMIVTTILAVTIIKLSEKTGYKWLKYLYS